VLKTLIVDDEPIARQVLRELLEEFPGVTLAGEAASGLEAVELVARTRPDLVLLDLQMPGLDGFAVARSLRGGKLPLLIFVTAFEAHALAAFESGAVDYLLKPVRKERLATALEKARAQVAGLAAGVGQPEPPRRLVGKTGSDLHLLDPADVIAFVAEGDTVTIIATGGRYYSGHSLKALEERLRPPEFRRIHRRTIINTAHIRRISPLSSRRWLLKMSNGMEAIVSKRLAGVIRESAGW
jgi:DNA-binding LytR/AlgR family response regulator